MQQSAEKAPVPDHVPAELVFDFNVYGPENGETDLHTAWRQLRQKAPPIIWTPYHGGHWLPTRFEDIDFIQRNHDPFSMRDITMPANLRPTRVLPLESDPPEHLGYRMVLNPFFTPSKSASYERYARDLAIELIEEFKPHGRCEFMQDFALQMPIAIFMRMTNLPMSDAPRLLEYAEMATRGGPEVAAQAQQLMLSYILPVIEQRRAEPGDDILSAIIHAQVRKQPVEFADMVGMILIILFGGLDTVASTMGFMAKFLAESPDHRQQLIADPSLIPDAVDEMMRRFAPSNTARTMSRDYEYKGIRFREGDKVYVSPFLAGIDDERYDNAWEVNFNRGKVEHNSFGAGAHRCPGQLLALVELRVFVEEWLARIPEFRTAPADPPRYGPGQVNCMTRLVLEWDV